MGNKNKEVVKSIGLRLPMDKYKSRLKPHLPEQRGLQNEFLVDKLLLSLEAPEKLVSQKIEGLERKIQTLERECQRHRRR